jgi:hypothetical protein
MILSIMLKIKKENKKLKYYVVAFLFAVALLSTGLIIFMRQRAQTSGTEISDGVNLNPPTDKDQERVEENKQRIIDDQSSKNDGQQSTEKKSVTPTITYLGQNDGSGSVEIGASVGGVFEDGGTCTATFSKDNSSFSKSVAAIKNVKDMSCPMISASRSEFGSIGLWSVIVSYKSPTYSGVSTVRTVEVN